MSSLPPWSLFIYSLEKQLSCIESMNVQQVDLDGVVQCENNRILLSKTDYYFLSISLTNKLHKD